MTPVHFPDDPFIDTEALAAEQRFRDGMAPVPDGDRWRLPTRYTRWAAQVRAEWEATSEHVKAMRARQRREGAR